MRLAAAAFGLLLAVSANAQRLPVGDALEDYVRVLQLTGAMEASSFTLRPGSMSVDIRGVHPWQELIGRYESPAHGGLQYGPFDPVSEGYVNSSRPWGQNDGAIWQGRGATTSLSAGLFARYRFMTAALRPRFVYVQNGDFSMSSISPDPKLAPYGYPWRSDIDLPQRFGPDPISRLYLGNSYLQAVYRGLAAGLSTENMWWGPGIRNAILMSNNAPGFRHAYVRTQRPADIRIGTLEGSWIWGSLAYSEYFVDASYTADREVRGSEENRRFLTGLIVTYEPKWIPDLYVGAAQSYMVHAASPRYFADYFAVINLPFVNDTGRHESGTDDKIVSLFGRWVLPQSGFEVYGEWARGDHTSTFRDFFVTPDHSRGFTLGFQKVYRLAPRYYTRIGAEHTFLEALREVGSRDRRDGGSYFYTHEGIKQGYTHRGQVLGAGIGPGSQGQFFRLDLFAPVGRIGVHALREVFDNDLFYTLKDNHFEHQVDIAGGFSWLVFYQGLEMEGSLTRIKTFNRDFQFDNDTYNTNLRLSLRYALGYR